MENIISYKGYEIVRFVAVIDMNTGDIIDECDSMAEAKRAYRKMNVDYIYGAAEIINKDGDTNPSVYGSTLAEATNKLKKILKG